MTNIKEYVHEKRPSLSASSVTTYSSILRSLYTKVFSPKDKDDIDMSKFDEVDHVLDFLKDVPANRRKTILSALVIITGKQQYKEQMMKDVKTYSDEIAKQEKSPEQEASWVDTTQVHAVFDELKKDAALLYKKKNLTARDMQQIQNFIILALLGGVYIPPRRSKDYCDFRIANLSPQGGDNFLEKNKMVFTSYKTAKTYGRQEIEIPPALRKILKQWIEINPTDYLLFDSNRRKLTSVKLNQRLVKIFGDRKVGVNALRHSFLTNKFGSTIDLNKQIDDTMTDMGSSPSMLTTYVKK